MKRLIVLAVCILSFNFLHATHVMGGDITYKLIDPQVGRYRFTISLYRSCAGAGSFFNDSLDIRKNGFKGRVKMNLINKQEVTPLCLPPDVASKPLTNCPGTTPMINGIKGVERAIYEVEVLIGKNIGWAYVGYIENLRNSDISTGQANQPFYIQSGFNTNFQNSSPLFTTEPIPYWCKNIENTYNHGAVDTFDERFIVINGQRVQKDLITYEMICPFIAENSNISEAAKLNNTCASQSTDLNKIDFLRTFNSEGVDFNPTTGDITCRPANINQDAVVSVAAFEYRAIPNTNGIGFRREKIGYVIRDIQFTIHDQCDPIIPIGVIEDSLRNANYISSTEVDVCGTSAAHIVFKVKVPATQNLKTKVTQSPSNQSVFNYRYSQNIKQEFGENVLYGVIDFDSSKGAGQDKFTIQVYYCTTYGIKVSRYYTMLINYKPAVKILKNNLYYCIGGKPVRAHVRGATKYSWKKDIAIDNYAIDSSWVDLAPTKTQYFYVKGIEGIDSATACTIEDSVQVIVIPKFNYTLSPKNPNLCLHDTLQIQISTQTNDTPYQYRWVDVTGSMFNNLKKKTTTISNPIIVALNSASYPVEIENKYGCILLDTIKLTVNGVRPNATATSNRVLVCPGDTTMLSVQMIPKTCGPSIYKTVPDIISKILTSTITNEFPTSFTSNYPAPYSTVGLGQSSVNRIIYTKAQLEGMGLKPGVIKSISFEFIVNKLTIYDSFEIRLGSTASTSLDARIDVNTYSMFKEYNHISTANQGLKKYNFARGFDWNGEDNLVVETYAATAMPMSNSTSLKCLNLLAGNQVAYKFSDKLGEHAEFSNKPFLGAGPTASKPIIYIDFSLIDSSDINILNTNWSPLNLVNKFTNTKAIATSSQSDSLFIAQVGTPQCYDTAAVKVKIDTTLKVNIMNENQVICKKNNQDPTIILTSSIKASPTAIITWKSISPAGIITSLGNQMTQSVTPSNGQWKFVVSVKDTPCFATDTVSILVQDSIRISLAADMPLCTSATGRLQAILPAGTLASQYKFLWSQGNDLTSDTLTNLLPKAYSLTVKLLADETCQGSVSTVLFADNKALNVTIVSSPIKCFGGNSDSLSASIVTGSGNYNYLWNNTAVNTGKSIYNQPSIPINYQVSVTDVTTGCQGVGSFLLTQPSLLEIDVLSLNPVKCKGDKYGSISVQAKGGVSSQGVYYQWSSIEKNQTLLNTDALSNLFADSIYLTVTDANGCIAERGFRILEPIKKLTIDTIIIKNATSLNGCDGLATGYISGGTSNYNYYWTAPARTILGTTSLSDIYSNLCKGQYNLKIIDSKGCEVNSNFSIKDIECNWTTNLTKENINCFGDKTGKIKVDFLESKNLSTTNYTCELIKNSAIILTQNLPYQLNAQSHSFPNLAAGVYYIHLKTNLGCDTTLNNIVLTENPKLTAAYSIISPSCKGYNDGEIQVSATDKFRPFQFNFGSGMRLDSFDKSQSAGINKLFIIQNALGCQEKINYQMTDPDGIKSSIIITDPTCFGLANGKIAIKILPENPLHAYRYENKPGSGDEALNIYSPLANEVSAGSYSVNLFYANNEGKYCDERLNFTVNQPPKFEIEMIKTDSVSCPNYADGKIEIGLKGGTFTNSKLYDYSIDGGATYFSSNKFIKLKSGDYNVAGRDNNNCFVSRRVTIFSPEELVINAKADETLIKIGDQTKLSFDKTTQSGVLPIIQSTIWSPNTGLSCTDCSTPIASPYQSTNYQVDVRYHKNCLTKSSILINVESLGDLFVPSAFTPGNLDGLNDHLMVYGYGIKSLIFQVFNRWGEKVFEGNHQSKGWNGLFKNEPQISGVYSYIAQVEYLNGTKQIKKGSSTLIR